MRGILKSDMAKPKKTAKKKAKSKAAGKKKATRKAPAKPKKLGKKRSKTTTVGKKKAARKAPAIAKKSKKSRKKTGKKKASKRAKPPTFKPGELVGVLDRRGGKVAHWAHVVSIAGRMVVIRSDGTQRAVKATHLLPVPKKAEVK